MKDVQQQEHFLFKTASICVCLFVRFSVVSRRLMAFKTDERAFSKTSLIAMAKSIYYE